MKTQMSRIRGLVLAGTGIALAGLQRPAQAEDTKVALQEPERAPVGTECRICLRTYVHDPAFPGGQQLIREECDYAPESIEVMRRRQLEIAAWGTYSNVDKFDWGTWYGAHRIDYVTPILQPSCN